MKLEEAAEEVLESLWVAIEEEGRDGLVAGDAADGKDVALNELTDAGMVTISDGMVVPTGQGFAEARNVVRRHRLAERLLVDVLGSREGLMHERACKFEHLLDRGLDENICILLGHPKICPHGKPIPPGSCCVRKDRSPEQIVEPLSAMNEEEAGKVAYIFAPEQDKLNKLMAMGIVPGAPISLLQRFPSYVFESGQSQFAVDREIADSIYVRVVPRAVSESAVPGGGASRTTRDSGVGRHGGGGKRRGRWWWRGRR